MTKKYLLPIMMCLIVSVVEGCVPNELSRSKAEKLLGQRLVHLKSVCSLDVRLSHKPEFASLKNEQFCEAKIVVTGIRKTQDTEAVVEYTIRKQATPALHKWIDAFSRLEVRLASLEGTKRITQEFPRPSDLPPYLMDLSI